MEFLYDQIDICTALESLAREPSTKYHILHAREALYRLQDSSIEYTQKPSYTNEATEVSLEALCLIDRLIELSTIQYVELCFTDDTRHRDRTYNQIDIFKYIRDIYDPHPRIHISLAVIIIPIMFVTICSACVMFAGRPTLPFIDYTERLYILREVEIWRLYHIIRENPRVFNGLFHII